MPLIHRRRLLSRRPCGNAALAFLQCRSVMDEKLSLDFIAGKEFNGGGLSC
jgi:hypothetical protein